MHIKQIKINNNATRSISKKAQKQLFLSFSILLKSNDQKSPSCRPRLGT